MGGGGEVKRPALSLGPPFELILLFVISNGFGFLRVECAITSFTFSFFNTKNRIAANILKKWRPFPDCRVLTCFFEKIVPKRCFLQNFMLASQTERF